MTDTNWGQAGVSVVGMLFGALMAASAETRDYFWLGIILLVAFALFLSFDFAGGLP